jgi:tripartite-type tricarboxylate transporter receptor subunit TctC
VTPEVPTMEEGGIKGLVMPFWHGMWAPKGTPPAAIAKLNAAVIATFEDPAARKRFTELGHEIPSREQLTPEALRAHHKAEVDKWWPIMRAANMKAEKK